MIRIKLTDEEKDKLIPIRERMTEDSESGKPGMVIGQIYPRSGDVAVGYVPYDKALEIQKIMWDNVGATTSSIDDRLGV